MTHIIRKLAAAFILALLAPLAFAQGAFAPAMFTPFKKGGGLSSGATISGCTSSILYADASSLLKCDPAAVVNGSVSTAGRSILTIRDTISGSSATSNFLNITGTFPATLSAETSGVTFAITGDNDGQAQYGLKASLASLGNTTNAAIYGDVSGATCGTNLQCSAVLGVNSSTDVSGIGTRAGGLFQSIGSSGAARNFGVIGAAYNSNSTTGAAYGGWFTASNNAATQARAMGVIGQAWSTATVAIGGYFGFQTNANTNGETTGGLPAPTGVAALVADNSSVAANIFEARDNGSAVFTIGDGGGITATGQYTFGGGSYNLQTNGNAVFNQASAAGFTVSPASVGSGNAFKGTHFQLQGDTTLTPDGAVIAVGATSNSLQLFEIADDFDFQNACTTGLGTAACTDPTLIVHSHNQDTGEFLSMAHDGKAGVIVGGNSTVLNGTIRLGGTVTLTESSATSVLTVPVAVSTGTGGEIIYTVEAKDATNTQIRAGKVLFAVANNSGGTETCGVYGVVTTQAAGGDTTNAANPTQVQDGSGVGAITSGTLTYAWSVDTSGTNQCILKLNAVSSLTQTTLQVHYTVIQSGPGVSTGGD